MLWDILGWAAFSVVFVQPCPLDLSVDERLDDYMDAR